MNTTSFLHFQETTAKEHTPHDTNGRDSVLEHLGSGLRLTDFTDFLTVS